MSHADHCGAEPPHAQAIFGLCLTCRARWPRTDGLTHVFQRHGHIASIAEGRYSLGCLARPRACSSRPGGRPMPSDTTKPDADEGSSTTASGTSTTTSRKASKAGKASATADEKAASGSATRADEPTGGRGDDQSGRNGGARHGRTARKADQAVPKADQGGPK